jgi:hypothetical protein
MMKKVKVTIHGKVMYSASRTIEIEVADDEDLSLLNTETLNDLADESQVAWSFGEEGYVEPLSHEVEAI